MNIINNKKISSAVPGLFWWEVDGFLRSGPANKITQTFPEEYMHDVESDGEKSYKMKCCSLAQRGHINPSFKKYLSADWKQLIKELLSEEYRSELELKAGCSLDNRNQEILIWSYPALGFLSPHTDKADKIISHVIYLNSAWSKNHGGQLNMLNSQSSHDIITRINPALGKSVIIRRSDSSWHEVLPVINNCPVNRRSIQSIFWRGDK